MDSDGQIEAIENPPARMEVEVSTEICLLYPGIESNPRKGEFVYALDDRGFVELHFYELGVTEPVFRVAVPVRPFGEMSCAVAEMALRSGVKL